MPLVKGPWTVEWGDIVLDEIEEMSVEYEVESNDVSSVQGRTYTITGAHKASASITLLSTDILALKAVFPQYWVPNGSTMSSGETVTDTDGAIDVLPGALSGNYGLIITSSGSPNGQVFRLLGARTEIEEITFPDDNVRRVVVTFIGETDASLATVQFFKEGALGSIS